MRLFNIWAMGERMRYEYLAVLAIVIASAGALSAQTIWHGGVSGSWTNASNWDNGLPSATNKAVFDGDLTMAVTDVSGDVESIDVSGASGQSVLLTTTADFKVLRTGGYSIKMFFGNALTIAGGANLVTVESHIYADNGDLTISGTVELGDETYHGNLNLLQHNGNVSLGDTTLISPDASGTTNNRSWFSVTRSPGGTGTITFGSLTVQGERAGGNSGNYAGVTFLNHEIIFDGDVTLNSLTGAAAAGNGGGARMYLESATDCTVRGDINVGQSGATAGEPEGPIFGIDKSTLTFDADGKFIVIESESTFFSFESTITSSSNVTTSWGITCISTCDSCAIADSTISAAISSTLQISLAGTKSTYQMGAAMTGTSVSGLAANGLIIGSGAYLTALNGNTFTSGTAGGTFLNFSGALHADAIGTANNNLFNDSTLVGGKWVIDAGATMNFRALAGDDFEVGTGNTNAATALTYTTTTGGITWSENQTGISIVRKSFGVELAADTTADQVFALYDVTGHGGTTTVNLFSIFVDFLNYGGGFSIGTDVATVKFFVDEDNSGTLNAGDKSYMPINITSGVYTYLPFGIPMPVKVDNGQTKTWGMAVTFNSSITAKSASVGALFLPQIGSANPNPIGGANQTKGLVIASPEVPVSGVVGSGRVTRHSDGAANGAAFSVQPQVTITDANGNPKPLDNATTVTARIKSGAGALSGTLTLTAVDGVVDFTDLVVTGTGLHTLEFEIGSGPIATVSGIEFLIPLTSPEIDVQRSTVSIVSGTTDNVGTATVLTYEVLNTGTGTLVFSGSQLSISNESGCAVSISTPLSSSTVAPAASATFTLTVTATGGAFSFDILIESNDADEGGCVASDTKSSILILIVLLAVTAYSRRRRQA